MSTTDITPLADDALLPGSGPSPEPAKKPRPNHQRTLQILRAMSPQEKLAQVFKLNERTLELMRIGLRRRFPNLTSFPHLQVDLLEGRFIHNRHY